MKQTIVESIKWQKEKITYLNVLYVHHIEDATEENSELMITGKNIV